MNPSITEIIPEDKYLETTTQGLIGRFSRPEYEPTEEEVANLVIKYFWEYCTSGGKTSLWDITALMHIYEYYFAHLRFMKMGARFNFSKLPDFIKPVFEFAKDHKYPVSMLWDVSSTTALVRAIIMHNLEGISDTSSFHWLDIGSGTWILTLAHYILAKRKWFKSIRVDWLEKNSPVARRSQNTLRRLVPGNIFHIQEVDSTKANAYRKISHRPDFVSIEMLPQPGSDLVFDARDDSGNSNHHDPFLPTVQTLVQKYSQSIQFNIFPLSLRAHISYWDGEISFCTLPMMWENSVFELCSVDFSEVMKVFKKISIYWAQLTSTSEMIPLGDVGAYMHKTPDNPDGWIKFSPLWMHRWKKMIEHNPEYNRMLSMYGLISKETRENTVMPILEWSGTVTP